MNESFDTIEYIAADGKQICVEVSTAVKELLEQSDRQINSQRRQDRRYLSSEEYIDGLTDTTTAYPHEDFADLVTRMDNLSLLYRAMETLSIVQKRRLSLYFFGGMTYRQIGEKEGVNHKSVARSVEQAIRRIKNEIVK